ncbi:MAG TPA: pyruvate formate lyase family protein [Syntrophorhabdaceae bacterium]|nr:pyruvate formate lyase family protein [Syntrophorhabdaceae bacterium]
MVTTVQIDEINKVKVLTDRVKMRREEFMSATPHLDAERSHLMTESWKETEGEPLDLRRAKAFKSVMEGISVVIRDGELIVGSQSKYLLGTHPSLDYNPTTVFELVEAASSPDVPKGRKAVVTDKEKESLLADGAYWQGRSPIRVIDDAGAEVFGDEWFALSKERVYTRPHGVAVAGRLPNYWKILSKGLLGIIDEANQELQKLVGLTQSDAMDRYYFLRAVVIACEAVIKFAGRHAELALAMAKTEKDPVRKKELQEIAEICRRVPANPAKTFREALQSSWFVYMAMNLETAASHEIPGRIDQYYYPFYENDLKEGTITRQEAAELLGFFWVKLAEMVAARAKVEWEISETNQGRHVTIGGVDANGKDASNELTYLVLETARQLRTVQPPVYLRCHKGTPDALWMKAAEVNMERGDGVPAFLNDEAQVPYFLSKGLTYEDARDWAANGCVYGIGKNFVGDRHITISQAKIFELTLHNGVDPKTGRQFGPKTGDVRDFTSLDQLYEAFKNQSDYFVSLLAKYHRLFWQVRNKCYSLPFHSAVIDDCISKGRNYLAGGMRYPQLMWGLKDRGHQNIADSLAAIKKLVFEEKRITMDRLLQAIDRNFEGAGDEEIRRMCLAAPKYGNDDDYVDEIFNDLCLWSQRRIVKETHATGFPMRSGRGGATTHAYLGKGIGALPDGRKAGEPLADGTVSPMRGADLKGPTAVINSATKVNHTEEASYSLFNMKLTPTMLKSRQGLRKFVALVKTYFDRGGYHVQFNLMGQEALREAKAHPEQHKDLLVRVAGYSAYFVDLSPQIQDDIIARTEHAL